MANLFNKIRALFVDVKSAKVQSQPTAGLPHSSGRKLGLDKLPEGSVLVYRSKSARSQHHRIYLDPITSSSYDHYKYASYDLAGHRIVFSNIKAEGYANVTLVGGQVCINSKKLVEQIFYSKKVEIAPFGRTCLVIQGKPTIAAIGL